MKSSTLNQTAADRKGQVNKNCNIFSSFSLPLASIIISYSVVVQFELILIFTAMKVIVLVVLAVLSQINLIGAVNSVDDVDNKVIELVNN